MPDLLAGCWAKIQRANEIVEQFEFESNAFVTDPGTYTVLRQFKNDGLTYAFVVKGTGTVPVRFSVLAGEAVYLLRSSLDWLVCALVAKNGGAPSRNHTFPLCTTVQRFNEAANRGNIAGISASAEGLIRAQQPYVNVAPDDTVFFVMSEFNRQDKHRIPLAVTATATIDKTIHVGSSNGDPGNAPVIEWISPPQEPARITDEGVEVFWFRLAKPNPAFEANATIIAQITLDQFGSKSLFPASFALRCMSSATAEAIQTFVGEFS